MRLRPFACLALLLLLWSVPAAAQIDEEPVEVDTVEFEVIDPDTTYSEWEPSPEEFGPPKSSNFTPRSGVFGGPVIEFTMLKPQDLDPVLDGDLVLYGGQGFILINGWMLGGGGTGATLHDLSTAYDQFNYGYGGFLTGYDFHLIKPFSMRIDLMIGAGGLTMIKKRPDLTAGDPSGKEILERFREESFFMLRPGISLGFSPLPIFDFRVGANYVFPVGGGDVDDLKNVAFGLQLMFGVGG